MSDAVMSEPAENLFYRIEKFNYMENPLVSVIIPTYNRAEFVKKAVESVLNQTYKRIEIIVVDGSPNNETEKMLQPYMIANPRIRYIHRDEIHDGTEKDKGNLAQSRNQAIRIAKGKYIATLDDDDFWSNEKKMEKQVQFLENNQDCVACGGGSIVILENKFKEPSIIFGPFPQEKDEDIRKKMFFEFISYISSLCFRKSAWEAVGGYDETLFLNEDWDFPFKLGTVGKLYNFQEYFITTLMGRQNKRNIVKFGRKKMKYGIFLIKKYQKNYPGASRAILYAQLYYFYYSLPFALQEALLPLAVKIKRIIEPIIKKI